MKRGRPTINIYLLAAAFLAVLVAGCNTSADSKKSKEGSTLRFHLETNPDGTPNTKTISVVRASPVTLTIQAAPFLDESSVTNAAVVETVGGYGIRILFNHRGSLIFDSTTSANRGRRMAIHSLFTEPRWLAAPLITRPITGGIFVFTPDATREEAERIARGLNNLHRERNKKSRTWGFGAEP